MICTFSSQRYFYGVRIVPPRYGQWKMIIYLSKCHYWAISVKQYQFSWRENVFMIICEILNRYLLCFSLSRSFLRTFYVDSASIIFVRSANYASVSLNGLVYTPSIVTLLCLITCPITVIDCQKTAKTRSSLHSDSRTVVSPSDVYSKIVTNLEHMLLNK